MNRVPKLLPIIAVSIGGVLAIKALAGVSALPQLLAMALVRRPEMAARQAAVQQTLMVLNSQRRKIRNRSIRWGKIPESTSLCRISNSTSKEKASPWLVSQYRRSSRQRASARAFPPRVVSDQGKVVVRRRCSNRPRSAAEKSGQRSRIA